VSASIVTNDERRKVTIGLLKCGDGSLSPSEVSLSRKIISLTWGNRAGNSSVFIDCWLESGLLLQS
jgi:hypothetical protein